MQLGSFDFYMPTHIRFEKAVSRQMDRYIQAQDVLIVADPFLVDSGLLASISQSLATKNVCCFSDFTANPSCDSVDRAAAIGREMKAGSVVGLGGGSALDIAKVVSCLITNEGSIYDYYAAGGSVFERRQAQLICIPTTAGTGSEVTNVGVFTDKKTGIKMPMLSQEFWPDYALLDSSLTYSLPAQVTASTGMDAFCHAIESYWNRESQPLSDIFALRAMKQILENIETAYHEANHEMARAKMLEASLLAGLAFSQTRTTAMHAISFPLTSDFGLNHGSACAISLPAFIPLACEEKEEKMQALAQYLGFGTVEALAAAMEDLLQRLHLPTRLSQVGVQAEDIQSLAEKAMGAAIIHLTPAKMDLERVEKILRQIL